MAQCVQESGLQIPAIETEDCLCQIGRNMLGTDPLMRVSNAVEFQRRNRTFSRIPLVTIARKLYILIAIIDTVMLPIGNTVRIRAPCGYAPPTPSTITSTSALMFSRMYFASLPDWTSSARKQRTPPPGG